MPEVRRLCPTHERARIVHNTEFASIATVAVVLFLLATVIATPVVQIAGLIVLAIAATYLWSDGHRREQRLRAAITGCDECQHQPKGNQ